MTGGGLAIYLRSYVADNVFSLVVFEVDAFLKRMPGNQNLSQPLALQKGKKNKPSQPSSQSGLLLRTFQHTFKNTDHRAPPQICRINGFIFLRSPGDNMDSKVQELLDAHFLSPVIEISRLIIHGGLSQKLLVLQTAAQTQFVPNLFPIWPALSLHDVAYMCQTEWVMI